MQIIPLLLIQLVIFQAGASVLDDSLLFSKDEYSNSFTAILSPAKDLDEKSGEAPANWSLDFGHDYYNSRRITGEKTQSFRVEFNYLTDSFFNWGVGLDFGSTSMEKLATFNGQAFFGKVWSFAQSSDSDWNPTFSAEFHFHGGSIYQLEAPPDPANPGLKLDNFSMQVISPELRVESALWEPWRLKMSYRIYQYSQDFSSRVVATNVSQSVARTRSPLFNSLGNLPKDYWNASAEYLFSSKWSLGLAFAQATEKLSEEKSQDFHALANLAITQSLSSSWGFGALQSGDGATPFGLINLNYTY